MPAGIVLVEHGAGEVEYSKAPRATFKYNKLPMKGPKKTGGNEHESKLCDKMQEIVRDEVRSVKSAEREAMGEKFKSPMLNAVAKIMRVMMTNPQFNDEYQKAKAILTKHPVVDFYLLFKTPVVFPPDRVLAMLSLGIDNASNVDTVKQFFASSVPGSSAAVLTNPVGVNNARDAIRNSIQVVNLTSNKKIIEIYRQIDASNNFNVDGQSYYEGQIYPDSLAAIFRSKQDFHLALDEAKFFIYRGIQNILASTPRGTPGGNSKRADEYLALFNTIKYSYEKAGLGNPARSFLLMPQLPGSDTYQTADFWQEYGLHMPSPVGGAQDYEDRVILGGDEFREYSRDLVNIDRDLDDELEKYDNCEFSMSEGAMNELRAYMKANDGKVPVMN